MFVDLMLVVAVFFSLAAFIVTILIYRRGAAVDKDYLESHFERLEISAQRSERSFKDDFALAREESQRSAAAMREETARQSAEFRNETGERLKSANESMVKNLSEIARTQHERLDNFANKLSNLTEANEKKITQLREAVEKRLVELREDNAQKLEKMRQTVDEKLQGTLEKRLGESFKIVSERLEQVHKGLGEMQQLASDVGDFKRVLTNVKTRGTWGEIQLGAILEQMLTPEQYVCNFNMPTRAVVEFAIKLPGKGNADEPVWLPVDSKFPQEDYLRLLEASERGDVVAIESASKELETKIKVFAKDIHDKYIAPPLTTDFAIMFLPTESLYAEVLRRPGLSESIQRDLRVTIAGPTTFSALLNSLQMGFRTLAIEKRSSEVWQVLGAVKNEFGKFNTILEKVRKQLQTASNTIDSAGVRTRAIERKLKDVEELPAAEAKNLIDLSALDEEE